MVRVFILIGVAALFGARHASAEVLTEKHFTRFISVINDYDCEKLPIGSHTWAYDPGTKKPTGVGSGGEDDRAFKLATLFESEGILQVLFDGPAAGGMANFAVALNAPVDGTFIRKKGNDFCAQLHDFTKAQARAVRTDEIQGGRTHWNGAIAYIELWGLPCQKVPDGLRSDCTTTEADRFQYRVLLKKNPFNDDWNLNSFDFYARDHFLSSNVPDNLQRD